MKIIYKHNKNSVIELLLANLYEIFAISIIVK